MTARHPVFHPGEIAVQDRAGVSPRTREMAARVIRDAMPDQHRTFFAALPMVYLALLDRQGRPWAIPICGAPGLVASPSPQVLILRAQPPLAGALALDLDPGARIGVLGIDLATRRRNRVNGCIVSAGERLTVAVEQSFGNCPQYIRVRPPGAAARAPDPVPRRLAAEDPAVGALLARADTFFIASRAPGTGGLDVSHRGGDPGFLAAGPEGRLAFPDYAGNRYFNTLGNIEADGRVGLVVPDFATGGGLVATGRATVDWDPQRTARTEAAERMIDVVPEEIWHVAGLLPAPAGA